MFISDCMNKLELPRVNKREADTRNITNRALLPTGVFGTPLFGYE